MNQISPSDHRELNVYGDVSGQIAMGDYIIQIGEVHGGIVNIIQPDKKPTFTRQPQPVYLRPHAFRGILNRSEELGTAVDAMRSSEPISIHGQNGFGKTTLLRHLAYNSPGDNFPDGIIYLHARGKRVDDLLQEIFDCFYESDRPAKPTVVQLHQLLQNVCALILLDDVELDFEQVSELINCAPQCVFVLTSSERCLWGEGRCIQLGGLPIQEALTLVERELGHSLADQERSIAEAFCRQIKGNPLYMIQGAALVRQGKTFDEIGDKFKVSEEVFTTTILDKLTDTQKNLLFTMAASGNFPMPLSHLEGLSRVTGIGAQLGPLLDLHIIQANSPAYNITGSLAISLAKVIDLSAWENRVRDYFVEWIKTNPPITSIQEVLHPLLFVLEGANRNSHWEDILSLGRGVERALILGKRWLTWLQVLEWILKAAKSLGNRAVQGWVLHQLGTRDLCLGNFETARQSLTQALSIRKVLGDQAGAAVTRHNLSLIIAPPAPPRDITGPKTGPAPKPGGLPFFKIILGLITVAAVAGLIFWILNLRSDPPPAGIVPPPFSSTSTSTYTPTLNQVPSPTDTPTLTFTPTPTTTATHTLTPTPTPTITPSPTPSNTPTPTATGSISITNVSANRVYYGGASCVPQDVTIRVRAIAPNGIKVVDLFYRFDYSNGSTGWKDVAMKPIGGDLYERVLNPTSLLGNSVPFQQATLKYQVVVQQNDGDTSARTRVMSDIGVQACQNIILTNTPDIAGPPAPLINWPQNDVQINYCTIQLQWYASSDPSGISQYHIELEILTYDNVWKNIGNDVSTSTGLDISKFLVDAYNRCKATGLVSHRWRVQAEDGAGNLGSWSEWAFFRTMYIP